MNLTAKTITQQRNFETKRLPGRHKQGKNQSRVRIKNEVLKTFRPKIFHESAKSQDIHDSTGQE